MRKEEFNDFQFNKFEKVVPTYMCDKSYFYTPYLYTSLDGKGYDYAHDGTKLIPEYCECLHCGNKMGWLHKLFCDRLKNALPSEGNCRPNERRRRSSNQRETAVIQLVI